MSTIDTIYPGKTIEHATAELTTSSPKRLARTAGIFYLLVGIVGGFRRRVHGSEDLCCQ